MYKLASFAWTIDYSSTFIDFAHYICLLAFFFSLLQVVSLPEVQKRIGSVSLYAGLFLLIYILIYLVQYVSTYGYISGKEFKYVMFVKEGLNVHMIAFVYGVFAFLSFLALKRESSFTGKSARILLALPLPFAFIYFIGARNVFLMYSVSLFTFVIFHYLKHAKWFSSFVLVCSTVALLVFVAGYDALTSQQLTEITTHRNALWKKSFDSVSELPSGYGYGTADMVLAKKNRFNTYQQGAMAGGAHSFYINALLEGGWVGLLLVVLFFLIVVADYSSLAGGMSRNVLIALIIGMWARGFVETSGFFGTANGVGDFIPWFILAVYYGLSVPSRKQAATYQQHSETNSVVCG